MRKLHSSRRDILKQIEAGKLSSTEALKLIEQMNSSIAPAPLSEENAPILGLFRPEWVRSELPVTRPNQDIGHILVLEKNRVVLVKPGHVFGELQGDTYEINPKNADDYLRLLKKLQIAGVVPAKIVHRCTRNDAAFDLAELGDDLRSGIFSIFSLSKALVELKIKHQIDFFYVYHADENVIQPQHSALSSFGRSLRLEHPNFRLRTVALDESD